MKITWKQIIRLTKHFFEINQTDIAGYLDVHSSEVSLLANGKIRHFGKKLDEIYTKLFDPNNPESPAAKMNKDPKELLADLKEILKEDGIDVDKSIPDNDYEKFVKGILKLARKNESTESMQNKSTSKKIKNNKKETISKSKEKSIEPEQESILIKFYQDSKAFAIEDFIDLNPATTLSPDRIYDAIRFIGRIKRGLEFEYNPDIAKFVENLSTYLHYLKENSTDPDHFPEGFRINTHSITTDNISHIQSLKSLFSSIQEKINEEQIELKGKNLAEYREAWRENSSKGSL